MYSIVEPDPVAQEQIAALPDDAVRCPTGVLAAGDNQGVRQGRRVLSEEEFQAKKAELLSRM